MAKQSLQSRLESKIRRSSRDVFLRADFERLADYDQVGRALRGLVTNGNLLKVGYGLYAKARPNRLTGEPMLAAGGGFNAVAEEALKRLKVEWEPSSAVRAYQTGSTQIPANAEVLVRQRFNRKIGTGPYQLQITKAQWP
jgi:hypothetical protein